MVSVMGIKFLTTIISIKEIRPIPATIWVCKEFSLGRVVKVVAGNEELICEDGAESENPKVFLGSVSFLAVCAGIGKPYAETEEESVGVAKFPLRKYPNTAEAKVLMTASIEPDCGERKLSVKRL